MPVHALQSWDDSLGNNKNTSERTAFDVGIATEGNEGGKK